MYVLSDSSNLFLLVNDLREKTEVTFILYKTSPQKITSTLSRHTNRTDSLESLSPSIPSGCCSR